MAFRDSASNPQLKNFGVGSIVYGELSSIYLVVRVPYDCSSSGVALMNITPLGELSGGNIDKFEIGVTVEVGDPNFLTYDEFGLLVDTIGLEWTRSDFEVSDSGLKGIDKRGFDKLIGPTR